MNKSPTIISKSRVPWPDGWKCYVSETKEMLKAGSYQGMVEVWNKYKADKGLNLPEEALDEGICKALKMLRGNNVGFCASKPQQPPMQQLIDDLQNDPRMPSGLRRGRRGQDAWAWASLHYSAWEGKLTPEFMSAFTARFGCGSCRAGWKKILNKLPPKYSPSPEAFAWTVLAHNEVNKHTKPPKPQMDIEAAKKFWGLS